MIIEMFQDIADILFSTGGITQLALIKASLWLLLFFIIFKGVEKVFPGNKVIALLIAAIVSLVGIRFMPDELFDVVMGAYVVVVGVALLLGPYITISIIAKAANLGKTVKWMLVAAAYGSLIYFLPAFGAVDLGSNSLDGVFNYFADNRLLAGIIFLAILILLIMLRRRTYGGAAQGAGAGPPGRGRFRRALGWIGNRSAAGIRGIGRGAVGGGRYLYEGAAFSGAAGAAYGARRARVRYRWLRRMWNRRRARGGGGGGGPPPAPAVNRAALQRELHQLETVELKRLHRAMVAETTRGPRGPAYNQWITAYGRAEAIRRILRGP